MKKVILFCFVLMFAGLAELKAQSKLVKTLRSKGGAHQKSQQGATQAVVTSTNSRPGRSVNYFWDDQASQWNYTDTSFYTYNLAGDLLSELSRNGVPNSRRLSTYDAQGRLTQELFQFWDNLTSLWINNNRSSYVYNNQGFMTEITFESYNTTTNLWELQSGQKNLLTYDASNRITDNIYQSYNTVTSLWENVYRETAFVYDANNNILSLESKFPNGANWDNDYKYALVYSINNKPVQLTGQIWNGNAYDNDIRWINLVFHDWCGWYCNTTAIQSGTIQVWDTPVNNQWNNSERVSAIYDAFGGIVETWEAYTGTNWENSSRYSEFVDNKYNYTGDRYESWDNINNAWEIMNETKFIHTYDGANNIAQTILQYWDFPNSALINGEKRVYSNFTFVGIQENQAQTTTLSIFPNPCSGECRIESNEGVLDSSSDYQFKIFDAQGKLLHSAFMSGSNLRFTTSGIAPGIYFFHLSNTSGNLRTGKLIVN